MRRRRFYCAFFIGLCAVVVGAHMGVQPKAVEAAVWEGRMIRLHVVASSDSEQDQRTKLAVRDALLQQFADQLAADTYEDAKAAVEEHLPDIQRVALDTARARGEAGPVTVDFMPMNFPTRRYENMIVPAGTYQALRVVIGAGQGANWWCVVYPDFCLTDGDCVATQQAALPLEDAEPLEVQYESLLLRWWHAVFS